MVSLLPFLHMIQHVWLNLATNLKVEIETYHEWQTRHSGILFYPFLINVHFHVLEMLFFTDCGSLVVVFNSLSVKGPHVAHPRELLVRLLVTTHSCVICCEVIVGCFLKEFTLLAFKVLLSTIYWNFQIELLRSDFPLEKSE